MLRRLTKTQKLIFEVFVDIINQEEYPSLALIAKRARMDCSRTNIFMHIQYLMKKGYIEKTKETPLYEFAKHASYAPTKEGIAQYIADSRTNRIKR